MGAMGGTGMAPALARGLKRLLSPARAMDRADRSAGPPPRRASGRSGSPAARLVGCLTKGKAPLPDWLDAALSVSDTSSASACDVAVMARSLAPWLRRSDRLDGAEAAREALRGPYRRGFHARICVRSGSMFAGLPAVRANGVRGFFQ